MNLRKGIWQLADPKISVTSAAALLIAFGAAYGAGNYTWVWLAVTALSLFGFEVAKNAWGDIVDYDSGTDLAVRDEDRTPFSGGKRVLVDELLTRRQTWLVAEVFGGFGAILGLMIVIFREPRAFWFGLAGTALAWSYHGPPLKLAYRGLGELAVAISYGPVIVTGAYLVQTGEIDPSVFRLSVPLGLLVAAFLWVNEFPDHDADKASEKKNLVVRFGKKRAALGLIVIYSLAFGLIGFIDFQTGSNIPIRFGLTALLPAAYTLVTVLQNPLYFYRTKPAQQTALLAFVAYAFGVMIDLLIW